MISLVGLTTLWSSCVFMSLFYFHILHAVREDYFFILTWIIPAHIYGSLTHLKRCFRPQSFFILYGSLTYDKHLNRAQIWTQCACGLTTNSQNPRAFLCTSMDHKMVHTTIFFFFSRGIIYFQAESLTWFTSKSCRFAALFNKFRG